MRASVINGGSVNGTLKEKSGSSIVSSWQRQRIAPSSRPSNSRSLANVSERTTFVTKASSSPANPQSAGVVLSSTAPAIGPPDGSLIRAGSTCYRRPARLQAENATTLLWHPLATVDTYSLQRINAVLTSSRYGLRL